MKIDKSKFEMLISKIEKDKDKKDLAVAKARVSLLSCVIVDNCTNQNALISWLSAQ